MTSKAVDQLKPADQLLFDPKYMDLLQRKTAQNQWFWAVLSSIEKMAVIIKNYLLG